MKNKIILLSFISLLSNFVFGGSCSTLDCIFNSMVPQTQSVPTLINYISYLSALVFAYKGVLKLKEFNESKGQVKITSAILYFVSSGCLFGLPVVINAGRGTIGLI